MPSIYSYSGVGQFYFRHIHPFITPYTYVLGLTAQTSSGKILSEPYTLHKPLNVTFLLPVYLTLTVTVERYIAVCHPLRARSWCTCKRGRLAVIIIGLCSLCYNLPRFFEVDGCLYIESELGESWIMVISIHNSPSIQKFTYENSLFICSSSRQTSGMTRRTLPGTLSHFISSS